jgi:hypothetical protein
MTLNVVLGDGEMPTKELIASLEDLRNRAKKDNTDYWFLIQAKAEPTATDRAFVSWLLKEDIWFNIVYDGSDVDPMYLGEAQEKTVTKRMAPTIIKQMKELPSEGEDAQLLGLFVSDDFTDPKDRWLNDVGAAVQEAGFKVRALNDGLVEVDMLDGGDEPEDEDEEDEEEEVEEAEVAEGPESLEGLLDEMTREQLISHAAVLGITFPPRTRMNTMVSAILNHKVASPAEELDPEPEYAALTVVDNTTPITYTVDMSTVSAPAMMIIVSNGTVTSKVVTAEQVENIMSSIH